MIKVTLPDGAVKELPKGSTPMDVALSISEGLARNVISAKVNDTTVEVTTPITNRCKGYFIYFRQRRRKESILAFFCTYLSSSARENLSWS
jgi:(p)ppGpp synthase/HD superfamily hydrolase